MWTRDESSREVVHNAWQTEVEGSHSYRLVRKQDVIKAELKRWNKTSFGYTNERINELEAKLAEIQKAELSKKNLEKEAALSMELDEWQARNETKWNKKLWELWIKEGDKNTRFFHLSTLKRMRRNVISEIKLDDGSWTENMEVIQQYFKEKFCSLYQTSNPNIPASLEELIQPSVSEEENESLCEVPSREEIRKIVFETNSLKAPGPDGLLGLIYKYYWDTVGEQVILAVQSFFRNGWILKEFNQTFIVLIPKVKGAHNLNKFQPISLCNVCYKIIPKILVKRLRPLLSRMIDESQVAFVPSITENVVLAQEMAHSFKTTKRKKGWLGIKLDFKKAYYRMEWSYLMAVLKAFGFNKRFIVLINQCISKVQFTILLNGGKTKDFNPARWLRQGIPLSPYLFLGVKS